MAAEVLLPAERMLELLEKNVLLGLSVGLPSLIDACAHLKFPSVVGELCEIFEKLNVLLSDAAVGTVVEDRGLLANLLLEAQAALKDSSSVIGKAIETLGSCALQRESRAREILACVPVSREEEEEVPAVRRRALCACPCGRRFSHAFSGGAATIKQMVNGSESVILAPCKYAPLCGELEATGESLWEPPRLGKEDLLKDEDGAPIDPTGKGMTRFAECVARPPAGVERQVVYVGSHGEEMGGFVGHASPPESAQSVPGSPRRQGASFPSTPTPRVASPGARGFSGGDSAGFASGDEEPLRSASSSQRDAHPREDSFPVASHDEQPGCVSVVSAGSLVDSRVPGRVDSSSIAGHDGPGGGVSRNVGCPLVLSDALVWGSSCDVPEALPELSQSSASRPTASLAGGSGWDRCVPASSDLRPLATPVGRRLSSAPGRPDERLYNAEWLAALASSCPASTPTLLALSFCGSGESIRTAPQFPAHIFALASTWKREACFSTRAVLVKKGRRLEARLLSDSFARGLRRLAQTYGAATLLSASFLLGTAVTASGCGGLRTARMRLSEFVGERPKAPVATLLDLGPECDCSLLRPAGFDLRVGTGRLPSREDICLVLRKAKHLSLSRWNCLRLASELRPEQSPKQVLFGRDSEDRNSLLAALLHRARAALEERTGLVAARNLRRFERRLLTGRLFGIGLGLRPVSTPYLLLVSLQETFPLEAVEAVVVAELERLGVDAERLAQRRR